MTRLHIHACRLNVQRKYACRSRGKWWNLLFSKRALNLNYANDFMSSPEEEEKSKFLIWSRGLWILKRTSIKAESRELSSNDARSFHNMPKSMQIKINQSNGIRIRILLCRSIFSRSYISCLVLLSEGLSKSAAIMSRLFVRARRIRRCAMIWRASEGNTS